MRIAIATAALMGLTALSPAFAEEAKCNRPESSWKPVDELKTKLTTEGWTISNVKTTKAATRSMARTRTATRSRSISTR